MTGKDLRALRKSWGLKQAGLAELLGYSVHTISDIERGKKSVTNMLEKHVLAIKALKEIEKLAKLP